MEITRVEKLVKKSRIAGTDVDGLPKRLRMRMVRLLNKLAGVKRINIEGKARDAIFELSDRNVTLTFFDRKIRKEFLKTIELLQWYRQPHWHSTHRGVIGAPVHCAHCSYSSVPGAVRGGYCPVPSCPSHEKWRLIIGSSYEPPKTPKEDLRFAGFRSRLKGHLVIVKNNNRRGS